MTPILAQLAPSAILSFLLIIAARSQASRLRLIDRPAGRKRHEGEIPVVGGLAIYAAFLLAATLDPSGCHSHAVLIACMGFLVVVGAVDDAFGLGAGAKFAAQLLVTLAFLTVGELPAVSLPFASSVGALGALAAVAVTALLVPLIINSVNLADGVDGLAGGLMGVSLILLGVAAALEGRADAGAIIARLAVPLLVFLLFNARAPWRKQACVFMGDAGTLAGGCAIAWLCLELTRAGESPLACTLVLAIPIADTVSLFFRRIFAGRSPFQADRQHLHHLLEAAGVSAAAIPVLLTMVAAVVGLVGLVGWRLRMNDGFFLSVWTAVLALHTGVIAVLQGCARSARGFVTDADTALRT